MDVRVKGQNYTIEVMRMPDLEKVIEGLRHCTSWAGLHECQPKFGPDCPYDDEADCKLALMRDALAMLNTRKVGEAEMKKQICLTQDDIRQIIANAFSVDTDKVDLEPYKDLEGYGVCEHYVAKVKATVEVPMNDQR